MISSAMISGEPNQPSCSPAIEHQLHAADAGRKRQKAEPIEAQMLIALGLVHERQEADHREDADRQIDQKTPSAKSSSL